jgi:hypothetical protein
MKRLIAVAAVLFAVSGSALAQPTAPPNVAEDLIGGTVYAAGGTEVGKVAAVTTGTEGRVTELRITTASPLGFGQRTAILPRDSFMLLRGAVVLDLSPAEVDALPSVPPS